MTELRYIEADQDRRVEVNGASLVYNIAGEDNEHTIVVLHGGRGLSNHRKDFRTFSPLADRYRVIGYDQRGHGQSSLTPPYTFEQLADDLEGVRLKLGDGKPMTLIAGSFGGMIALTYAVKYPHGLASLVLRGTAPSWHHEAEALEELEKRIHKAPMATREMVHKVLSDTMKDDDEFRLIWFALMPIYEDNLDLNKALETARRMEIHTETHNALFKVKDYDVRDQLHTITAPTLVVCGAEDWICPPNQSRLLAEGIPNAELLMVPNCGHYVHVEANALVLGEIRKLLGETAAS